MRIRLIQSITVNRMQWEPGLVLDVPEDKARYLIKCEIAVAVDPEHAIVHPQETRAETTPARRGTRGWASGGNRT
jgi:hypothetical protein